MTTFTAGPASAMTNSASGFSGMRSRLATPPIGYRVMSRVPTPNPAGGQGVAVLVQGHAPEGGEAGPAASPVTSLPGGGGQPDEQRQEPEGRVDEHVDPEPAADPPRLKHGGFLSGWLPG